MLAHAAQGALRARYGDRETLQQGSSAVCTIITNLMPIVTPGTRSGSYTGIQVSTGASNSA